MDILLLGIYAFLVWLIFIKLKWLPWTTPWKVGVFIFPVVALATLQNVAMSSTLLSDMLAQGNLIVA